MSPGTDGKNAIKKLNTGVKIKKERIYEACTATSFDQIFKNHKGSDSKDPVTVNSHAIDPNSHKTHNKQESMKSPKSTPKVCSTDRVSTTRSGRAKLDHTRNLTPKAKLDGIGELFARSNTPSHHKNGRSTNIMPPEQIQVKNADEKSTQPVILGSSEEKCLIK